MIRKKPKNEIFQFFVLKASAEIRKKKILVNKTQFRNGEPTKKRSTT